MTEPESPPVTDCYAAGIDWAWADRALANMTLHDAVRVCLAHIHLLHRYIERSPAS